MLRSVIYALAAAVIATFACLVVVAFTGGSAEDVAGFGVLCFASSLGLALLVYVPARALTHRTRRSRGRAMLWTVTVLNAPAYVALLAGLWRGGMFGGWSEIALFAAAYAICGIAFVLCAIVESG
jgi:hypothetical protein